MTEGQALRPLSIHQQTRIDFQFFDQQWPVHAIIQYGVRNSWNRDMADEWEKKPYKPRFVHGDEWGNAGILHNMGHIPSPFQNRLVQMLDSPSHFCCLGFVLFSL